MKRLFCYVVLITFSLVFAKPMESIERYNIILIHGAADSLSGMYCGASDLKEAFAYYDATAKEKEDVFRRTLSYYDISWDPYLNPFGKNGFDLTHMDTSRSNATGMIKTLPDWINDKIFDGERKDRFGIYLNRPFINPANTPIVNGGEIGNRAWQGRDNCKIRRSLTEEAEEMRNHGRDSLLLRRKDVSIYRRYDDSIGFYTHRNILIAHSMGGLASREYVQGDAYNGDVDKVITLDSPHKGTYSLNGLLDMKKYISSTAVETLSQMSLLYGTTLVLSYGGFTVNQTALLAITYGFIGLNALNAATDAIVDLALSYGFTEDDPLVEYIVPNSTALKALNMKGWNESAPMFRILYGVGGLTFGSPEEYFQDWGSLFVPDGLFAMVKNIIAQVSHTEIDDPAWSNNIIAGGTLGLIGGLGLTDQGSILIPHWSGAGEGVSIFEEGNLDFVRVPFAANEHVNQSNEGMNALGLIAAGSAALIACEALNVFSPAAVKAAKSATALAVSVALASWILPPTIEAAMDMTENHDNPSRSDWHEKQKSAKNSYAKILGGIEPVESYLLEDFLYEKPFVNLSVYNANDWAESVDSTKMDSLGLYGARGSLFVTTMKDTRSRPLKFKSPSDWGKMGVKTERWERIDGLNVYDSLETKSVPIRHVERYEVPAITVEDWIETYSFVVDDLMPHRLRQIRLNFNFQEEIAWECDISKDPQSDDACNVYKRTGGGQWDSIVVIDSVVQNGKNVAKQRTLKTVKHPVKKNGQFNFVPDDYGIKNKLAIQKDNQNTVTISTVNKIGLSNTQRFYYLFKATANKLDPVWPQRDVVLNKIRGFKAYASALGYQGFRVVSAKDYIIPQFTIKTKSLFPFDELDMESSIDWYIDSSLIASGVSETGIVYDSSSAYWGSLQKDDSLLWEGDYLWKIQVAIDNIAQPGSKDSSNTYEVPFKVDRTPPEFLLKSEGSIVNPDSNSFVARFTWTGSQAVPDIRAIRVSLKKMDGDFLNRCKTRVADFPAMADVASKEFAIQWNSVTRDSIRSKGDGKYCIEAYAVDYAVPDSAVYKKMIDLVDAISAHPGSIVDSLWPDSNDFVNSSVAFDSFFVDTKAPVMSDGVLAGYSPSASIYSKLSRPGRKGSYAYATKDSLLKISYKIVEPLNGRDSVPVTVAWNFIHLGDTAKVDHAGDSVWVKNGDAVNASWTEMSGMRLEDGDYRIRAVIRDVADNDFVYNYTDTLRVDKTAPHIESLVSTKLVYPDSFTDYSATITADERHDVATNRTGMHCHYRISGCGNTTGWKLIPITTSKYDSVKFKIDSLEGRHGKCYLEAACVDAAGNVSVKTDLFYMGERTPVITSPYDDYATTKLIAITGIAPPYRLADSLNTIYRLRYARIDSLGVDSILVWETSGISVVSALQNDKYRNVSRASQSNDAVLGYLDRNLGNGNELDEGTYIIELGTCAAAVDSVCIKGPDSLWVTDTATVVLRMVDSSNVKYHFVANPKDSLVVGKDSLDVSLHLSGLFNSSYFMRVYAKDSANVGLFDESVSKVWRNPYYGAPNDTSSGKSAVWFYEQEDGYHLQWNGLAAGDTLEVTYDSLGFGHTCEGPGKNNAQECRVRPFDYAFVALPTASGMYFEDFPELRPLSSANRKMLLTGSVGHVVMTATRAFHVSRANAFADTTLPKMKVYFGDKSNDGFYWIANGLVSSDTLDPLLIGWTVDPRAYGLNFKWDGVPENGMYPAKGTMTIYAEITENVANNPLVIRDSIKVRIKLPELEVVLPDTLPDLMLMKKDSALVCADETTPDSLCERRAFKLGSMVAKYGIKYRDAKVMACIVDASGTCIAVL